MKTLAAGKYVLGEKPAADTAEAVRAMFELAERKRSSAHGGLPLSVPTSLPLQIIFL
jgi:hypothetical protein